MRPPVPGLRKEARDDLGKRISSASSRQTTHRRCRLGRRRRLSPPSRDRSRGGGGGGGLHCDEHPPAETIRDLEDRKLAQLELVFRSDESSDVSTDSLPQVVVLFSRAYLSPDHAATIPAGASELGVPLVQIEVVPRLPAIGNGIRSAKVSIARQGPRRVEMESECSCEALPGKRRARRIFNIDLDPSPIVGWQLEAKLRNQEAAAPVPEGQTTDRQAERPDSSGAPSPAVLGDLNREDMICPTRDLGRTERCDEQMQGRQQEQGGRDPNLRGWHVHGTKTARTASCALRLARACSERASET